jgi:glycosyltransferase involved in cell wall biosynthesis
MNQKSLKIIIVYDCIYPESLGGVEHRNYQLAKFLTARGHQITLSGWTSSKKSSLEGVEILSLPGRKSLYNVEGKRTALTSLKFAWAVTNLSLKNFDLIATENIPYIHLFPLSVLAAIWRKPLLITWHEYWGKYWQQYIQGLSWIFYLVIEWLAAQLGNKVITVSAFTAQRLQKNRLVSKKIDLVPNGVNLATIVEVTQNITRVAPPLIYAGRLMREKRINLLLEAVAKLPCPSEKVILQIIGDGPERDYLESLSLQLGIASRVKFLGRLATIEEVWQQIARAKIAVQPSEREGFGIFPLEAMAVGTPVIYCESSESAVAEIVRDGVEGIRVAPNSQALAKAIAELLADGVRWNRLSNNAQIRAKNYDWASISQQLEQTFYQLI